MGWASKSQQAHWSIWMIALTTALISHASKVMLKILQARLQQYVNCEIPDVQAGFRKAEESEIKLPTSAGSWKSKRVPEKHLFLLYWLCQKPLTVWITINCGQFWKKWEYQTTWPASWETCLQVRKKQLDWTRNNKLVPNRKRSTSRLYIVTPLIELLCRVHHEKCWTGKNTS